MEFSSKNQQEVQSLLDQYEHEISSFESFHQKLSITEAFVNLQSIQDYCASFPFGTSISLWILGMYASFDVSWTKEMTELRLFSQEITWFPAMLRHLKNLRRLHIEFNPITEDLVFLSELSQLEYISISIEQRERIPTSFDKKIIYADMVAIGMKRNFLYQDVQYVPQELKHAKALWQNNTEEDRKKAIELVRPMLHATFILDGYDEESRIFEVLEEALYYLDEDIYLWDFYIDFGAENAPYVGACAVVCLYFSEDSYISDDGVPRSISNECLSDFAYITNIELHTPEMMKNSHDWSPVYEGLYTAYFLSVAHLTRQDLREIARIQCL